MRPAPPARLLALLALAPALAGCDVLFGVPLDGAWSGTYRQAQGGRTGVLLLELSRSGDTVTGDWESSLPGELARGELSGAVEALVMLELTSDDLPGCRFTLLLEQQRGRLDGGYVADCGDVPGGWVELAKR